MIKDDGFICYVAPFVWVKRAMIYFVRSDRITWKGRWALAPSTSVMMVPGTPMVD